MARPYIPLGWTHERLNRAGPSDFALLPEKELDRVLAYLEARGGSGSEGEREAKLDAQLRERQNAERERLGLPPRPDTPQQGEGQSVLGRPLPTSSQLVEVVEKQGVQADWGFLLFRTDYSDESRWEKFEEGFNELVDKSTEDDEAGSMGIVRIEEGLMVKMVVDEGLEGASMADVRGHSRAVKEAGEVPKGLDLSMCLVVDAASIASLVDGEATPFVIAVDTGYDATDDGKHGYQGYFKVAISSLLPDLYPPLASGMRPNELWPFAKPVFRNAYGIEEQVLG